MSALLHNELWPDLQYSRETRHESRGLPTITRPDNLWSELQDLMPVMSSKHSPRGLSGYSSKFLSPLHSGVPHVQWIRSCPLGQGWTRGWPHWGVWLAHEKPGSPAPSPNGPASGSSGKRNILDENICLKPRTLDMYDWRKSTLNFYTDQRLLFDLWCNLIPWELKLTEIRCWLMTLNNFLRNDIDDTTWSERQFLKKLCCA